MSNSNNSVSFFQIVILLLSIYSVGALAVSTFFEIDNEIKRLIDGFDIIVCAVFFVDFIVLYRKAENKLTFWKWGWIDLLSCIPSIDILRGGRVIRVLRIFRVIRLYKSSKFLYHHLYRNKTKSTFSSALTITVFMIIASSISILQFEDAPTSNIHTAEDAIWWTFTTITTVGYGDKYPVTHEGRLIAVLLMTTGVALFGIFTGYISSQFVSDKKEPESNDIESA